MKSFGLIFTLLISGVSIVTAGNGDETTPRVVNYTLVNAETNEDIFDFTATEGWDDEDIVVLDLTGLAHPGRINIRVNTEPPVVSRVSFGLDGDDYSREERSAPYALFGDINGDYKAWQEVLPRTMGGSCWDSNIYHWCSITLYTDDNNPDAGEYNTFFRFRLKYDDIRVTGFTLVNAITDQDIADIQEGDVIDLSTLPTNKLNIRANTEPSIVGKVVFGGNFENVAPYSLYGDRNGNYNQWKATPGFYQLGATPYSEAGTLPGRSFESKGVCGIRHSVSFEFIQSGSNKTTAEIIEENDNGELKLYPNPNEGFFIVTFLLEEVSNVKIEIFDMFGKTVFHEELLSFSGAYERHLNLSAYPRGVYLLRVDDGEATRVRKVALSER